MPGLAHSVMCFLGLTGCRVCCRGRRSPPMPAPCAGQWLRLELAGAVLADDQLRHATPARPHACSQRKRRPSWLGHSGNPGSCETAMMHHPGCASQSHGMERGCSIHNGNPHHGRRVDGLDDLRLACGLNPSPDQPQRQLVTWTHRTTPHKPPNPLASPDAGRIAAGRAPSSAAP